MTFAPSRPPSKSPRPSGQAAARLSAGVLVFRRREEIEFLLVHPGGPYWRGRDEAAWSIPKGLVETGEEAEAAARREFTEETGLTAPERLGPLTPRRQPGGKTVAAWLGEGDLDLGALRSNAFTLEWPPGSGRFVDYPEIDQARYFPASVALEKLHRGLRPILAEAMDILKLTGPPGREPPTA